MTKLTEKKAHNLYDKIVKYFLDKLGIEPSYDYQLNEFGRELFGRKKWINCFLQDDLKMINKILKQKGEVYSIVNTDVKNGRGLHWVGLFKTPNDVLYIYDSFGRKSNKLLKPLIKEIKKGGMKFVDSDYDDEQKDKGLDKNTCGSRSLAWLCMVKLYGIQNALLI